ncbi:MAG: holo-ACP synthase [Pseudomonadota bacterium]
MEIGIDIIEIARIDRLLKKYPNFRHRIFTEQEIAYCEQKKYPAQHYAARFAAKESIMKALGSGWTENIRWKDLEIVATPSGKPIVRLHGKPNSVGTEMSIKEIKVSLSHCGVYAVAVAQVIKA